MRPFYINENIFHEKLFRINLEKIINSGKILMLTFLTVLEEYIWIYK